MKTGGTLRPNPLFSKDREDTPYFGAVPGTYFFLSGFCNRIYSRRDQTGKVGSFRFRWDPRGRGNKNLDPQAYMM